MYLRILSRIAVFLFLFSFAQPLFSCEVWISSITHRDNVSPTVDITANKNCTGTLEIWIDGGPCVRGALQP